MEPIKLGRYRHFKGNEYEVVERDGKTYRRFTYLGE